MLHAERFDPFSSDPSANTTGRWFMSPKFQKDLTDVRILTSSVDTIRQIYNCKLDEKRFEEYLEVLQDQDYVHPPVTEVCGKKFYIAGGGKSGYQIRLQNNEEGLIIFLKTKYTKIEDQGSHIKIEVSPQVLACEYDYMVQALCDALACELSTDSPTPAGCAVHLALDVQGWTIPEDLLERLTCRSRRVATYDGIETADISLGEAAVTYGKRESITLGTPKGVQFCIYNKTTQAYKEDKLDYYESIWRGENLAHGRPVNEYDPNQDVIRLELRYHHTVLNEFSRGSTLSQNGQQITTDLRAYDQIFDHLTGLWEYGLNLYRLDFDREYVDPAWSLFTQDAQFSSFKGEATYKRVQKTPGIGNEKNVALAVGNIISISARHGMPARRVYNNLKKSGIWDDILGWLKSTDRDLNDFYRWLEDSLLRRRMVA